jgi:hypothetical protein
MMHLAKKIIFGAGITLAIILGIATYSFFFPREIGVVDDVRLPVQSRIMETVSGFVIGDNYRDNEHNPTEGPSDISLDDLSIYRAMLEPGDIFFTQSRNMGSLFIDGRWKHSIIYVGSQKELRSTFGVRSAIYQSMKKYYVRGDEELIIESDSEGVRVGEFKELSNLEEASYMQYIIAFGLELPVDEKELFLKNALLELGKPYDFDLNLYDTSELYCSEFVYYALDSVGITIEVSSFTLNRDIIMPSDIVQFMATEGVSTGQFSFLFFIEKEDYVIVAHNLDDVLADS